MLKFFEYNWQVRDEWFEWCKQLTLEDLLKKRIGGVESILYTLFHIIDVEYSWIRAIQGKEDEIMLFNEYHDLEKLKLLSDTFRREIVNFLHTHSCECKDELITVSWDKQQYRRSEILHHVIAHEIHHIGQLSVWSREVQLKPVSVNFIGRSLNYLHLPKKRKI
ncbi:DinB family protein [Niallia sp. 03091]|uniref:DinB family protein n=1 Tax=Niallia sp. 03091 TaxID=3458059 RepID=UPI0040441EA1